MRTDSGLIRLWLENIWRVMESGCGQSRPTHARNFWPFWNFIWTLVRTLLVTDLGISGLICNLQGCSGCFGTRCICKSLIDCTEKYIFSGFYWGYLRHSYFPIILHHSSKVPKLNLSSRSAIILTC